MQEFECRKCNKGFDTYYELRDHMDAEHRDVAKEKERIVQRA